MGAPAAVGCHAGSSGGSSLGIHGATRYRGAHPGHCLQPAECHYHVPGVREWRPVAFVYRWRRRPCLGARRDRLSRSGGQFHRLCARGLQRNVYRHRRGVQRQLGRYGRRIPQHPWQLRHWHPEVNRWRPELGEKSRLVLSTTAWRLGDQGCSVRPQPGLCGHDPGRL